MECFEKKLTGDSLLYVNMMDHW